MSEAQEIRIGPGDTELLTITISLSGVSTLDDLTTALLYMREVNNGGPPGDFVTGESNHVDGASLSVLVSADMTVTFDPLNNGPAGADAFAVAEQTYDGYVLITWSDADETRHPGAVGRFLRVVVGKSLE